jgi:hypothetical protein
MPTLQESTLLDLVQSVMSEARNDEEAVATIVYLINSGRVRLCGSFAGAKIVFPRKQGPGKGHYSERFFSTVQNVCR